MASNGKAPPPLRSRPPPDPPPFTIPPIPFESLTLTEPPEPPDPPDATFTFVLQVLDLESPASTMVLGTTSGVAPGVSRSRELSSTSTVRSTLPLCTSFSDLSLQSSCVEVSIFSAFELVSLGHVSCSDLENLVLSMAIQVQGLEYQLELYLSNSAIRALLVSLQDIRVDMSVLVLLLAVLKPPSLQYAALRSLEDWTLDVDILVVVCFVDTAVLNVYNSDAFHRLASEFRVHLVQNLLSVSVYGVRQAPRSHPDAAWNKDKSTSGLGWVFSGSGQETPTHGSTVESFISSSLIAEAITIRSTLSMALTLEFSTLKVNARKKETSEL
uniref:Uncharacterized protein n=1 Tax=Brassica campestris TaxID=3711 RepID=M4FFN6_BRACM